VQATVATKDIMQFRSWLRNEWNDIKGNLKYDIYKTLAGGVIISFFYSLWRAIKRGTKLPKFRAKLQR
jgi:hypothetical protein